MIRRSFLKHLAALPLVAGCGPCNRWRKRG
ncbi:MAG: hypothetical protein DME98_16715 [Verrucomicrobia bacterium]|nr:MAG: hypothetical protein DME98_16715 [Verrucomicrobiota bacterium]PYJ34353.1 MAG: hypothetical protein DME88_05515 [Verrucomicrobiota bacterium]